MSRSRKKTPIHGIACCDSEKPDKRIWHGRMRAKERDRLRNDPESVTTHKDDCGNVYCMGKDGKYWMPGHPRLMRK